MANGAHAQLCGLKEGFEAVLSAGSVVGSSKNPAVVQGSRRPRIAPEIGQPNLLESRRTSKGVASHARGGGWRRADTGPLGGAPPAPDGVGLPSERFFRSPADRTEHIQVIAWGRFGQSIVACICSGGAVCFMQWYAP